MEIPIFTIAKLKLVHQLHDRIRAMQIYVSLEKETEDSQFLYSLN